MGQKTAEVDKLKVSDALKVKELSELRRWKTEKARDIASLEQQVEQQTSTVSALTEKCKTLEESDAQKSKDLTSTIEILSDLQQWKTDTLVDIEKLRQNFDSGANCASGEA